MSKNTEIRVTDWMSFVTFVRHLQHYCFVLRGILLAQFSLVVLLGVLFAWCESIPIGQGVYFSLITATTAGLERHRSENSKSANASLSRLPIWALFCLA